MDSSCTTFLPISSPNAYLPTPRPRAPRRGPIELPACDPECDCCVNDTEWLNNPCPDEGLFESFLWSYKPESQYVWSGLALQLGEDEQLHQTFDDSCYISCDGSPSTNGLQEGSNMLDLVDDKGIPFFHNDLFATIPTKRPATDSLDQPRRRGSMLSPTQWSTKATSLHEDLGVVSKPAHRLPNRRSRQGSVQGL
ncbi:hypothetical protein BDN72DRAFT_838409 [Pluteus cervinus]|uniref:Uncharacterized protein n=1 Tax=Pluteus cervinus TaxID=181527 RepID=A0ACD3AZR3_9AGAR|nr:hypothetical protein BDN72DRAFT_838409 [Pluteus cervinus]